MSLSRSSAVSPVGRFSRLGRAELVSLAVAVAGGIAVLAGALVVPVYRAVEAQGSGIPARASGTLVGVNGWNALLVAGMPLIAALATGSALGRRAGRRGAGAFAWSVAMLLAFLNLMAMASIGIYLVPVTAALIVACATHRGRGAAAGAAVQGAVSG